MQKEMDFENISVALSLFIYFSLCFLCGFNCKGKEKHKYLDYGAVKFLKLKS